MRGPAVQWLRRDCVAQGSILVLIGLLVVFVAVRIGVMISYQVLEAR